MDRDIHTSDTLLNSIHTVLNNHKALDIVNIDLKQKSSIADHMVIATGRSHRHLNALADTLTKSVKKAGLKPLSINGVKTSDWILVDLGDVIVHLFHPEAREYYNLEKMWKVNSTDSQMSYVS